MREDDSSSLVLAFVVQAKLQSLVRKVRMEVDEVPMGLASPQNNVCVLITKEVLNSCYEVFANIFKEPFSSQVNFEIVCFLLWLSLRKKCISLICEVNDLLQFLSIKRRVFNSEVRFLVRIQASGYLLNNLFFFLQV